MQAPRGQPVWYFYTVAGAFGLAFLATLLVLAWSSAIQNETRKFQLETKALNETVASNVRLLDSAAYSVAAAWSEGADSDLLGNVMADLVARHAFVRGAALYRRAPGAGETWDRGLAIGEWSVVPALFSPQSTPALSRQIAVGSDADLTFSPSGPALEGTGVMIVARHIARGGKPDRLILLLADSPALLGNFLVNEALAVQLFTDSSGVAGRRQVLDITPTAAGGARPVNTLENEHLVRFGQYSVKLRAARALYWADLEKRLLLTALVLGMGIALLLFALARSKELQMRELTARNVVIEDTVRRQTSELAEARDQALEASRVKSDFLASMSHEIRTPLNAIIGMAELLSETPLSRDQSKYVSVFRRAGEALLALVNDILDLSKIEAGQLDLESIDFNLHEVIEHAVDIYAVKADEKGVELAAHIAADVPLFVRGDPARLRQIVLNLIGNALKFTEQGEIVVRVETEGDAGARSRPIRIAVSDTGIGIPADKLESIFGSFTQVDSSTTRKYGGTGLGLTISRRLTEMMGGRIWVESVEGEGSTFVIVVQLAPGQAQTGAAPAAPVDLSGLPVLVADDNETNRLILREVLTASGARVEEAVDGREAVASACAAEQGGRPFGLVLLDCRMPEMDGFEAAAAIRSGLSKAVPMMMLTSASLGRDVERAREMGLDEYLVKPLKKVELMAAVYRVLGKQEAREPREQVDKDRAGDLHAARILLAEDNPDNRLLIMAYLKKTPWQVVEAEDGQQALEAFRREPFDVVLMDVQMPVMDGHAATRHMRAFEAESGRARTPILALTAHAIREEMDKSAAAGCDAHLTKPIKKQVLLETLEQYLEAPATPPVA